MRRSPSPRPSLGERETRSPLGKKTCGGMGEGRFRVPRRPQNAFLLPEGEGQDEGKGGMQQPSRDLLFENPLPRLYPLPTSRNQKMSRRINSVVRYLIGEVSRLALEQPRPCHAAASKLDGTTGAPIILRMDAPTLCDHLASDRSVCVCW